MIVQARESSQLLITQPDHAALAARIMRKWRAGGLPESGRRADILIAIEEHDAAWSETDAAPTIDGSGRILDFMGIPDGIRRGVWPKSVGRLAGSSYAAALVAQHAVHVYRRYREEPAWQPFFAEMEGLREHHLSAAGMRNDDDLRRDYMFLRIGDLASLTFCCGWTDHQSDDSGSGYSMHLEGSRLIINPDPFDGAEVALDVPAREIPLPTGSAEETRRAFGHAALVRHTGVAAGR